MTNEELMQLFLKQQAEELAEIRQIQKIAEGVLDEYHITIPIKDMGSVVATLGGKIEEAKDAFDHGVIKTGDHSFILSLWQYKVPTDEPVAYYNYAATKLLGCYLSVWDSKRMRTCGRGNRLDKLSIFMTLVLEVIRSAGRRPLPGHS